MDWYDSPPRIRRKLRGFWELLLNQPAPCMGRLAVYLRTRIDYTAPGCLASYFLRYCLGCGFCTAVGQMTLNMTPESQQEEFKPEPQLLMGAASVSVFAYLFPVVGFVVLLVVPGALVAASLAYLHQLAGWRRVAVVIYGSIANYCLLPACTFGLTKTSIYAGLASLGLAALCIGLQRGRQLSAAHAGASFMVGAASSLPLSLIMAQPNFYLGLLTVGLVRLVLIWPQYFLHSRYLVARASAVLTWVPGSRAMHHRDECVVAPTMVIV